MAEVKTISQFTEHEFKKGDFTEREFTYRHEGYTITATVWNEASAPDPRVLFDFNNIDVRKSRFPSGNLN